MSETVFQIRIAGKIRTIQNGRSQKAFVDISLNNALIIKNIRVIEGRKGLFVSMPQHRGRDGKWYDTVYCPNMGTRNEISQSIISAYKKNSASIDD